MRGEVRLDAVSFRYDLDGPWTVRDIDLVGQDVRELSLDSVSGAIGLVSQETYLFHDTLGASDAELDSAVRAARIDRMVDTLPDGYDIVVGARDYRSSTVRKADQIVVLDGGRIGERGTHGDRMTGGGRCARLAGELIS